jgi:hypothetical protein
MKSDEARNEMTARVKAAFAKWRTFMDMPEIDNAKAMKLPVRVPVRAVVELDADEKVIGRTYPEPHYVEALHSVCARGTPLGRNGNEILAERV